MRDTTGLLTMAEAAKPLGVTKARVSQLAATGALEAVLDGGRKKIRRSSIERYHQGRKGSLDKGVHYMLMAADHGGVRGPAAL